VKVKQNITFTENKRCYITFELNNVRVQWNMEISRGNAATNSRRCPNFYSSFSAVHIGLIYEYDSERIYIDPHFPKLL